MFDISALEASLDGAVSSCFVHYFNLQKLSIVAIQIWDDQNPKFGLFYKFDPLMETQTVKSEFIISPEEAILILLVHVRAVCSRLLSYI